MPEQKINVQIVVDDRGSVVLRQFGRNAEEALGGVERKSGSFASMIKSHWLGISAAVASAYVVINKGIEWAEMGARALQAEESFRRMAGAAGESSERIVAAMKRASAETVDDSDLMQKAAKGMAQGLSGDEIVAITKAARVAARLSGEDVKTTYETITDALANQMPRALRRYGLITKEEMQLVERLIAAGVQDLRLIDIALENAARQEGKFGDMSVNTAEKVQQFKADLKDLKEQMGKTFVEGAAEAWDFFKRLGEEIDGVRGKIEGYGKKMEGFSDYVRGLAGLGPGVLGWREAETPKGPEPTSPRLPEEEREPGRVSRQMRDLLQSIENAKLRAELLKEIDAARLRTMESNARREVELTMMKTGDELRAEEVALEERKRINDAYHRYRMGEIAAEADARAKSEKYFDREYFERAQKGRLEAEIKARRAEEDNLKILIEARRYQQELQFEQDTMIMAIESENRARRETIERLTEIAAIEQRRRDAEIDHAGRMAGLRGRYGEIGPGDIVRPDYLAQENRLLSERWRIEDEIRSNEERLRPGMEGYDEWMKAKPGKTAAIAQIDLEIEHIREESEKAMIEFGDDWRAGMTTGFRVYRNQIGSEFQIWEMFAIDGARGMQNAVSEYFFDAITGEFQSFGDFMKNIGRSWGRALADAMAKEMMGLVFGEGEMFSSALSWVSDLFPIGGRAAGGDVEAGRPYIVGEKRPELFIPKTPGTILPYVPGSGQVNLTIPISIDAGGLSRREISRLKSEMEDVNLRAIERFMKRHS